MKANGPGYDFGVFRSSGALAWIFVARWGVAAEGEIFHLCLFDKCRINLYLMQ